MRAAIALLWISVGSALQAGTGPRKFSELALEKIAPIYQAIRRHPFNLGLADGTLAKEKFAYYSTQDSLYLTVFGKALAILATKLDARREIKNVFKEAMTCWNEEKEARDKSAGEGAEMAPATLLYTDFLLTTAAYKSREELAAAVLPCFWIYSQLARELRGQVSSKNPYYDWVKLYSSDKYKKSVDAMIAIADDLASKSSPEQRAKMLNAFALASRMEWYFWDEAYKMGRWKPDELNPKRLTATLRP